ncbi:MAG: hypothetical protein M0Z45_09410 [Actinomycetota bacterium]|nr:hypothetical protein [Actinomycetota bacterium]
MSRRLLHREILQDGLIEFSGIWCKYEKEAMGRFNSDSSRALM